MFLYSVISVYHKENTDATLIACSVAKNIEKNKISASMLSHPYDRLESSHSVEHFIDLKIASSEEITQAAIDN